MNSTKEIQVLSEEMEKLSNRISDDVMSTLVNLSGNQKVIECGTHIKIPTDAGYASYYKSSDFSETITVYFKQKILSRQETLDQDNYNIDDET